MAKQSGGSRQAGNAGTVIIRIALGAYFLFDGISNLMHPNLFITHFKKVAAGGGPYGVWSVSDGFTSFLRGSIFPHAEVFAWVFMLLGTLVGALLLIGLLTRLAAFLSLPISTFYLLAMWAAPRPNFYLYALLLVMGVAVLVAAAGRTFGFDALLTAKTKSRILW